MTAKKKKTDKRVEKVRAASSASVDYRVFKALAHPLRIEILAILNDRIASPNELRKELEEGLSQVSYHIKVLRDFQMIEQVKTEPRRGAVEHYYKATEKVFVSAEQLKLMPKSAQRGVWGPVLSDIEEDLNTSMKTGTFARRPDLVVGREVQILDGKAREGAEDLAAEFYERYEQLGVESDQRRQDGEGDGEEICTTAAVLIFDSAEGKRLRTSKRRHKEG